MTLAGDDDARLVGDLSERTDRLAFSVHPRERFELTEVLYHTSTDYYRDIAVTEDQFELLRSLIADARVEGARLELFVSPDHARLIEVIRQGGHFEDYLA
ncbi:MAG: hypothetical protein EXQ94_07160 [Alphaproteobacteria bacterium]|nr:hypothetical protein [Alphaproteobacteria bacterium]